MISLIHPSRERPEKSYTNSMEWCENSGCDTELIVSVDSSDPLAPEYLTKYAPHDVIISNNNSVVDATNVAAKASTGDILIYLSDDFKCFPNWGIEIEKQFEGATEPMLLKVDDCLQPFHVPVLTIPIMNRALYEKLGYFFHPDYKSMFVDEHLYWASKKLNALKFAPHLKFEHCHVSVGKAENDDTYKRSSANWDQGKKLFALHKSQGFPI